MKVALLNLTINQVDCAVSHRVEPKHDATLDLRFDAQRIDGKAAIDHTDHAIDGEGAILLNSHFDRLRDWRDRIDPSGHAAATTSRQGLIPTGDVFEPKEQLMHPVVVAGQVESKR